MDMAYDKYGNVCVMMHVGAGNSFPLQVEDWQWKAVDISLNRPAKTYRWNEGAIFCPD